MHKVKTMAITVRGNYLRTMGRGIKAFERGGGYGFRTIYRPRFHVLPPPPPRSHLGQVVPTSVKDPNHFDTDPDPYCFKEITYLKQYFLHIVTRFSLLEGPPGAKQQPYLSNFPF
jgi:hypothetical protein